MSRKKYNCKYCNKRHDIGEKCPNKRSESFIAFEKKYPDKYGMR